MSTGKPAPTLEQLAEEIAADGQKYDSLTQQLSKAVADGFNGLQKGLNDLKALVKGDDAGDEGADDEPEAGAGDADDEGKDKENGDAGYQDMRMGGEGGDVVDATEFFALHVERVAKLEKSMTELAAQNASLQKKLDILIAQNQAGFTALGGAMAPMAKGIVAVHGALATQHTPALSDVAAANADGARRGANAPNAIAGITNAKLAKAMQEKILDETQVRLYRQHGQFDLDAAKHDELVKRVAALTV